METDDEKNSEVFNEESEVASDNEEPVARYSDEKRRRRRVSDVIDSMGDLENPLPEGFTTPHRNSRRSHDLTSPDLGYSATPEPATPESVNVFMPDWLVKTPDALDANKFSNEESTSSPGFVASMPVGMVSDRYNMNHKHRGKCIVFNHEYFDTGFKPREGSSVDASRIEQTFQNLGFDVEILNDLEHAEVMEKISKLNQENHEDSDCICIFMLTHGLANDMICAKDVVYKADKIWKPFTADNCATLAGKPKLFFFQACRGTELDSGVSLQRTFERRTETDSIVNSYKIPTHADFLIAYSSVPGFYSWRNPTEGTWFIQCLCDVLNEYAETTDLLRMLTITARKVATERASYHDVNPLKHDKKQVPSTTSMLVRDIYFTPKNQYLSERSNTL